MHPVESTKRQQIKLDDTHRRTVVFVPLQHRAISHSPPLQRRHLPQWMLGNHHAPGMNSQVSGEAIKPVTHVVDELSGQPGGQFDLVSDCLRIPGVEILGETVDLRLG